MKTLRNFTILSLLLSFLALPLSCSLTGDGPDEGGPDEGGAELSGEVTLEVDEPLIRADGKSCAILSVKVGGVAVKEGVTIYDATTNTPVDVPNLEFTTTTPGKYSFWAAYKTRHSETVSITAISAAIPVLPSDPAPSSTNFSRKVLVMQFTGTNCGFCPYMVNLLRTFTANPSNEGKWVLAAIHTYNSSDPAYTSAPIDGAMGISGYPTAALDLDKTTKWTNYYNYEGFQSMFNKEYAAAKAKVGIALSTVLDGNQLVVKTGLKAAEAGDYGLALWVLEDGIKAKQANNGAQSDEGYDTHNNCVRLMLGQNSSKDFSGVRVSLAKGEEVEQYALIDLKDSWVGENLHVVGIVTALNAGGDAFTANNAVNCPGNSSIAYSYNK